MKNRKLTKVTQAHPNNHPQICDYSVAVWVFEKRHTEPTPGNCDMWVCMSALVLTVEWRPGRVREPWSWPCKPHFMQCMYVRMNRIEQYHTVYTILGSPQASFFIVGCLVSCDQVGGCVMWVVGMDKDKRWEKRSVSVMFVCMCEVCVRTRVNTCVSLSYLFYLWGLTAQDWRYVCVCACVRVCTCGVEDQSCTFSWFLPLCGYYLP